MTTTTRLLILAGLVLIGFGLGWTVEHWRMGVKLEACELRAIQALRAAEVAQDKAEAYAETVRLASQHQITKVEKVYVERKQKQAKVAAQVAKQASDLPYSPMLPPPYRVLHDFAATGVAPEEAANPDGTHGTPVDPRTFARTVAGNYANARDSAARLEALQAVVRASGCFELGEP